MWQTISEMRRLPSVHVQLHGDTVCKEAHKSFTRRHPRYKIIQAKRWGVALVALPPTFDEYLRGTKRQAVRTNRNRALVQGFVFKQVDPTTYLDDILAVNQSMPIRSGRPMDEPYVAVDDLVAYFADKPRIYGLINSEGSLRAYAYARVCGEVFVLSRLLGHGDDLNQGVMYLLVTEVIREMIGLRQRKGTPVWGMYDTFFGATPGTSYFKRRLGFEAYKVTWHWGTNQSNRKRRA